MHCLHMYMQFKARITIQTNSIQIQMKKEQILNQQQYEEELKAVLSAFELIFSGNSKKISYPETHNIVYKLCRKGQAEEIMNSLTNTSIQHFQGLLSSIDRDTMTVQLYVDMFRKVRDAVDRVSEILLYIETNYMGSLKKSQTTITEILNSTFFQVLLQNKEILRQLADLISLQKCTNTDQGLDELIKAINYLDEKEIFLPQYLYHTYNFCLSAHYKNLLGAKYVELPTVQFFKFAIDVFKTGKTWLQNNFMRVKGKKSVEELSRKIFENSFQELKQQIYKQKSKQIFQTSVLQFLNLLNQKSDIKQINDYNEWFVQEIKKNLQKIDRSDNTKFLNQFVKEYDLVCERLAGIKDFNINYKATFFFQNWINGDKMHFPRRLNVYIEGLILHDRFKSDDLKTVSVLFRVLKEKDFFQKEFRRACVLRSVYHGKQHTQCQSLIISEMQNYCGADWVQKLKSLKCHQKQQFPSCPKQPPSFSAIAFEDSVWPFNKIKCRIPVEMLNIGAPYKTKYEEMYKGRVLEWHGVQGVVIVDVRFEGGKVQFRVDTAMAIILLALQVNKFETTLGAILKETKFNYEDIRQQLLLLKQHKILNTPAQLTSNQSQPSSTTPISLWLNYPISQNCPSPIDLTSRYLSEQFIEKNDHEQLRAERKMMVESFIVKIMKSFKNLTKEDLYREIRPMIQSRGFVMSEKFVDAAFETLMDKRYIKDLQDGTYCYLPS